jgi:quinol monooxygenase YgiN
MTYCVLVEFELHSGTEAQFLPVMRAQASNSLALEAGCQVFDVWTASNQPGKVFLYEVYDDRAAFDLHLASAHFHQFDADVAAWIAHKRVVLLDRREGAQA